VREREKERVERVIVSISEGVEEEWFTFWGAVVSPMRLVGLWVVESLWKKKVVKKGGNGAGCLAFDIDPLAVVAAAAFRLRSSLYIIPIRLQPENQQPSADVVILFFSSP